MRRKAERYKRISPRQVLLSRGTVSDIRQPAFGAGYIRFAEL
jgi:hypothetical protein